jgi:dethiobiotin synthetase
LSAHGFFVTGTDTGIGKTVTSCALLGAFASRGERAVGMKPVAAGLEDVNGEMVAPDVVALRKAGNVDADARHANPYAFAPPIAPHLAAAGAGITISLAAIADAYGALALQADRVVVEGAGGALVPLARGVDMLDIPRALGLPVILVVGLRLGCLNHALLSALAVRARGLNLAGWIANTIDPKMPMLSENLETLRQALPAPSLGVFPYLGSVIEAGAAGAILRASLRIELLEPRTR